MKELNRLLTTYQRTSGDNKASLKDLLLPSKFSTVVSTVNKLAGYNPLKKTFRTPNVVDNLENSLKEACKELIRLIEEESDGFETHSVVAKEKWLKDVKNFISLVNTRWKAELDSLTNKEPQRRICTRSLKLSLVANIETLEDESLTISVGEVPSKINKNKVNMLIIVWCELYEKTIFKKTATVISIFLQFSKPFI